MTAYRDFSLKCCVIRFSLYTGVYQRGLVEEGKKSVSRGAAPGVRILFIDDSNQGPPREYLEICVIISGVDNCLEANITLSRECLTFAGVRRNIQDTE